MTDLDAALDSLEQVSAYFDVRGARNTGDHFRHAREALVSSGQLTERDLRCVMSALIRTGREDLIEPVLSGVHLEQILV